MGMWGGGPFDNDTAADWLDELDDVRASRRGSRVSKALRSVGKRGTLGSDTASEGFAAAALVVLTACPELDPDVERVSIGVDDSTWAAAGAAVQRLRDPRQNELADLWAETGAAEDLDAELARWADRLAGPRPASTPTRASSVRRPSSDQYDREHADDDGEPDLDASSAWLLPLPHRRAMVAMVTVNAPWTYTALFPVRAGTWPPVRPARGSESLSAVSARDVDDPSSWGLPPLESLTSESVVEDLVNPVPFVADLVESQALDASFSIAFAIQDAAARLDALGQAGSKRSRAAAYEAWSELLVAAYEGGASRGDALAALTASPDAGDADRVRLAGLVDAAWVELDSWSVRSTPG